MDLSARRPRIDRVRPGYLWPNEFRPGRGDRRLLRRGAATGARRPEGDRRRLAVSSGLDEGTPRVTLPATSDGGFNCHPRRARNAFMSTRYLSGTIIMGALAFAAISLAAFGAAAADYPPPKDGDFIECDFRFHTG